MFAMCMDLNAECRALNGVFADGKYRSRFCFVYEPEWFKHVTGLVPDFIEGFATYDRATAPRIKFAVIEYKPAHPSTTHLKEWAEKSRELYETILAKRGGKLTFDLEFLLYYGSVFTNERSVLSCESPDWIVSDYDYDWIERYENEVRAYRFDLK